MKRSPHTALAVAMLLGLALASPVNAQPQDVAGTTAAPLAEDDPQAQAADDESQAGAVQEASSDDLWDESSSSETTTEEDGTVAGDASSPASESSQSTPSESTQSESKQFKSQLKRMLIGLLLPTMERRVRKAIDADGDAPQVAEAEPEPGHDP